MSDCLTRGFRAQLTITMEAALRRAVFEVMNIFENTVHDYKMELAQKGEEVSQLKIKLQTAELKLKDIKCQGDREAEINKSETQTQREPEAVVETPRQPSDVTEIDVEVPDDWCAPLGSEIIPSQGYNMCPSVRLRPLSIRLQHIPILKHKVVNCDTDLNLKTRNRRSSKRLFALKKELKPSQSKTLPVLEKNTQHQALRNIKILIQDIKKEFPDQTQFRRRRSKRNLTREVKEQTVGRKNKKRKVAATESNSTEQEEVKQDDKNIYTCKICKKGFDTEFGQSVHTRSHRKCQACKKIFPSMSALSCHKKSCVKLKKLLAKQPANPQNPSCDGENTSSPSKKQTFKKEGTYRDLSTQGDDSARNFSCQYCNKNFKLHCRLMGHIRCHTGEKPFSCRFCPRKFFVKQAMRIHMTKVHKGHLILNDSNEDLMWTKPLDETEASREDVISHSQASNKTNNHNKDGKRTSYINVKWQTMGSRQGDGFICMSCNKFVRNKRLLVEHFRIHTGERPITCEKCHAKFRTKGQLYIHRKKRQH